MRQAPMIPRRVGRPPQFAVIRDVRWWRRYEERLLSEPWMRQLRDVGRLLATQRLRRGMTQRQLADLIGTTPSAISRLERARAGVTLRTLQRVADALGLELLVGVRVRREDDPPLPHGLTGSAVLPGTGSLP